MLWWGTGRFNGCPVESKVWGRHGGVIRESCWALLQALRTSAMHWHTSSRSRTAEGETTSLQQLPPGFCLAKKLLACQGITDILSRGQSRQRQQRQQRQQLQQQHSVPLSAAALLKEAALRHPWDSKVLDHVVDALCALLPLSEDDVLPIALEVAQGVVGDAILRARCEEDRMTKHSPSGRQLAGRWERRLADAIKAVELMQIE